MNYNKKMIMKKLGSFRHVDNVNDIPNQYFLYFENGCIFQSYNSIIVIRMYAFDNEKKYSNMTFLFDDWDCSTTTRKYRNIFLEEDKKETERKINLGIYKIVKG